ncbi:recombinase A [Polyangium sp. 6x1]|uniref:recombinase A n=1 Tax=Polyangium sp. 6x1 TaxID=3042689 RepID=UPI0024831141|nr:recombinase A [Polyangium sp. 6x1]MDI1451034.1 recombinase A [Polyangium sp. 6x1]
MHRAAAATVLATDADARHKELFQSALVRPAIEGLSGRAKALPLGLGAVDASLPEGGLPRGAVVELTAPQGLARSTTLALSLCASAQAEARLRGESDTRGAWCAWLDPVHARGSGSPSAPSAPNPGSLFAPAVARAGVDLERLLVVRPDLDDLARVAVRVAGCHAFSVVVVDTAGVPGCRGEARLDRWVTIVRRLALAIEGSDTTVLLLTDAAASRAMPLPAAMRIELERLGEDRLGLRVAKDRRGRVTGAQSIELGKSA